MDGGIFTSAPTRRGFLAGAATLLASTALTRPVFADDAPTPGGTLVVAADTEPRNLNPAIVASNGVFYVASKVIEPLAEMSFDGPPRPVLATSWQGSADGLSFTFNLRKNVSFHDGEPFTSADVAFSALQVWKPLQNLGQVVFANLATVDTPDKHTAIFRFSKPTPPQLIENALPALTSVLPKHLYDGTDIANNPHNIQLVGTGPFQLTEYAQGQYYRLTKNPNYWDTGKPYLDGIIYRVLPDRASTSAALESGEVQLSAFSGVPLVDLKRLATLPQLSVITKGYEGITYQLTLEINHANKALSDVRVRRALAHAIDQKVIVDTIFLGYAQAAQGPIPETAKTFFADGLPTYPFDPKAAEKLLDEAGHKKDKDGVRFRLRLLPAPWFEQTVQTGTYVRQALKAVGIEVEIVSHDAAGHTKAVYTDRDFDIAIGSPVYRNDPAISTTILFQGGLKKGIPFSNQYNFQDPKLDAVIAEAAITIDTAKRIALYKEFQHIVVDELPILNLVNFTFVTVANKAVHNVSNNPRWATSSWYDTWLTH